MGSEANKDRGSPESRAESLFARFLAEHVNAEGQTFEEWVRAHPDHEQRLRALWEDYAVVRHLVENLAPVVPTTPQVGDELAGYRIVRRLGSGAMGVVFEGLELNLGRRVALKFLPELFTVDPELVARLQSEAGLLARIEAPNVVRVYRTGLVGGAPFMAMEFVEGGSLFELLAGLESVPIARRTAADLRQTANTYEAGAVQLVRQMLVGLQAIHEQGIVHRDVKPANVLIPQYGNVKIADLGLAKDLVRSAGSCTLGTPRGTPLYMSPEQATGSLIGNLDQRSDLFSCGVVLYELLTGRRPFKGSSWQQVFRNITTQEPARARKFNPRVGKDLWNVLKKALEKNYEHRYLSAREFVEDLERYLRREPVVHGRPTVIDRLRRLAYPQSRMGLVAAGLVVVAGPLWPFDLDGSSVAGFPLAFALVLSIGGLLERKRPRVLPLITLTLSVTGFVAISISEANQSFDPLTFYENLPTRTSQEELQWIKALWDADAIESALRAAISAGDGADWDVKARSELRDWQARTLLANGRAEEAQQTLESAIEPGPTNVYEAWRVQLRARVEYALKGTADEGAFSTSRDHPMFFNEPIMATKARWERRLYPWNSGADRPWLGLRITPAPLESIVSFESLEEARGDTVAQCPPQFLGPLARTFYLSNDLGRAERYARASLVRLDCEADDSQFVPGLETLACLQLEEGKPEGAVLAAELALQLSDTEGDLTRIAGLLARSYSSMGRSEDVKRLRDRIGLRVERYRGEAWLAGSD